MALAQTYPSKPVKLVVPYPAGSATDAVARAIGTYLSESLGQSFVIENRPGAQAMVGAEYVARSASDGYTILVTTNTAQAANLSLFKRVPYDPVKDFTPIVRLGITPVVLVVRPDVPANSVKEFISHMKTKKGATAGYGTATTQVSVAMLKSMGGFEAIAVPYKGLPQAMIDVLGGRLDFTFVDLGNAQPQEKAGKLRVLGITSLKRSKLAPEIPSIAETLPGYDLVAWFALMAPAGTPKAAVAKIESVTMKGLLRQDVESRFKAAGAEVAPLGAEPLATFIESEIVKWRRLAAEAKIEPE